jgi:hypothetical protein
MVQPAIVQLVLIGDTSSGPHTPITVVVSSGSWCFLSSAGRSIGIKVSSRMA